MKELISIYQLKPRFQKLLRPGVRRLAEAGVTANQVTTAAALLSVATGAVIALNPFVSSFLFLLPPVLFLRMALNAVDGMLAREHGLKSPLGQILNELGDVISDAALYLPFALIPGISPVPVVLITVLAIVSEMAGVLGTVIGGSRRYDGPMGKSDRAFVFGLLALILAFGIEAHLWVDVILSVTALLIAVNVVIRVRRGVKEAE
ncbi:CDP-alcohol phosphatidyltransferase family protein [Kroppenstedtia guangzhouensis]|uniref:CDP-alcohol phosphatidyltransferase family protein n=1 Tax=Kroppenstedtia guangzhouensis TaxID=1274356 RepID=UPI001E40ABC7|nr:CDP-alcohol phosphatidyltransferase family protein [Kroppenstedtia guangzhouensis]